LFRLRFFLKKKSSLWQFRCRTTAFFYEKKQCNCYKKKLKTRREKILKLQKSCHGLFISALRFHCEKSAPKSLSNSKIYSMRAYGTPPTLMLFNLIEPIVSALGLAPGPD